MIDNFDFQDGVILVCVVFFCFLLLFQAYLNIATTKFVENIEELNEGKIYRLKALTWFYKGKPPTHNQSAIHKEQALIKPCMLLRKLYEMNGYVVFEVKANECKGKKLNRQKVYYKKELFDNLDKIEIG